MPDQCFGCLASVWCAFKIFSNFSNLTFVMLCYCEEGFCAFNSCCRVIVWDAVVSHYLQEPTLVGASLRLAVVSHHMSLPTANHTQVYLETVFLLVSRKFLFYLTLKMPIYELSWHCGKDVSTPQSILSCKQEVCLQNVERRKTDIYQNICKPSCSAVVVCPIWMSIWAGTSCSEWLVLYSFGHKVCSTDRPRGPLCQSSRPSFAPQIMHEADSLARLQTCVSIWEPSKQNLECSAKLLMSDPGNSR